ncbi:MAG: homoserine dehydrogenase [Pirellulaceae bacterium]|nr:homoserine dehydrogenase [Pirellulaceae bacterium]
MEKTKVALIGFGTIGSGVAKLLLQQPDRLARHAGKQIELAYVVDKDLKRDRGVSLPKGLLSDDMDRALDDPDVKIVIELIGGTDAARTLVLRALESGKDVVTANKALLATHGPELFGKARERGRTIAFEAAVAGGIPIIAAIGQSLTANRIESIEGILNGTCNYILTQMEEFGVDYDKVVADAQRLGYAEADPTMDVEGIDATQKLAILAQLAFGAAVRWQDVSRVGVSSVRVEDMAFAQGMDYRIRLVATARRGSEGLELCVGPTLIPGDKPLAGVQGVFNAVAVVGDAVGPSFFQGLGAGQDPTASSVVADIIDTIAGRTAITFGALNLWSEGGDGPMMCEPRLVPGRYYLRLNLERRAEAAAEVVRVLREKGVGVNSLVQYEDEDDENLGGMVLMTQRTTEGDTASAMEAIERLPFVRPGGVRFRVAD